MLSAPFARALAARRSELNARFAEARHRRPALAPDGFGAALVALADPVVAAVDACAPERAEAVALAAYEVMLDLVGQGLTGADARGAAVCDCWRRALPAVAPALAADPPRILAALTNAAYQVAATPDARAGVWVGTLAALGSRCPTADAVLRLGEVAAWQAGLAQYRQGAIAAAAALPEAVALDAVRAPPDARWVEVAAALAASEWHDPAAATGRTVPAVAREVGAFRGFGGPFAEPPRAGLTAEGLCLTSGDDAWLLTADRFGATFHRAGAEGPGSAGRADVRVTAEGRVDAPGGSLHLPPAGRVTSAAATRTTLAVTWSHSHHVTLVALA